MFRTNIHILDGDWKSRYVKKGDASFVELAGPHGTLRIHIPHADARALEAVARITAFALRMNDGTLKLKAKENS